METKSIKIAKPYNNADFRVLSMIDDFCNKWVDLNGNERVDLGEDWGYAKTMINSSFNFSRIIKCFRPYEAKERSYEFQNALGKEFKIFS